MVIKTVLLVVFCKKVEKGVKKGENKGF